MMHEIISSPLFLGLLITAIFFAAARLEASEPGEQGTWLHRCDQVRGWLLRLLRITQCYGCIAWNLAIILYYRAILAYHRRERLWLYIRFGPRIVLLRLQIGYYGWKSAYFALAIVPRLRLGLIHVRLFFNKPVRAYWRWRVRCLRARVQRIRLALLRGQGSVD